MHYYQHNIKTFNSATRHLTRVERALYRDLIEIYYDTEKPLTSNIDRLSRLVMANSNDEKESLSYVLSEFFILSDESYRHEYCDETIDAYQSNKSAKSIAGIASAEARKAKAKLLKSTESKQDSTGVEQVLDGCATNKEPLTINHKPETKDTCQKSKISPCPHEKIIDLYHKILPELQGVNKTLWKGSKRERDLSDRWKQNEEFRKGEFWDWFFKNVKTSNHHMGGSEGGWRADLGWLVKKENFIKLVERFSS
tara:strand:- start:248 stop:1006 length:759 start_codon:yes stop_codon:yes gene_type:complete